MKFTLDFDMGNAAFDDGRDGIDAARPELVRIFERITEDLRNGALPTEATIIRDVNGNRIGSYQIEREASDDASDAITVDGFFVWDNENNCPADGERHDELADAERVRDAYEDDWRTDLVEDYAVSVEHLKHGDARYGVKAVTITGEYRDPTGITMLGDRMVFA